MKRTLVRHAAPQHAPHAMLRRMLDHLAPDTPAHGDGSPTAQLEHKMAELLGKPRVLFFPSGTMAQQVAVRLHAERSGRPSFAAHPTNHLSLWEQQGYAVVHGLRFLSVGDANRLITLDDLTAVAESPAALLLELPQREIGGLLPTWDELTAQVGWARDRGAAPHLDGARLFEAQPFYDRSHAEIAALFDTVYVSIYKGLGGVRGGLLAGDEETIAQAAVWRQRLGGAIPDAWPLALAGLLGLVDDLPGRMAEFRDHAVAMAAALTEDGTVIVHPNPPQTPLFHVHVPRSPAALQRAGEELLAERGVQLFTRAQSQPLPDRSKFEVSIGENALDFTPDEDRKSTRLNSSHAITSRMPSSA